MRSSHRLLSLWRWANYSKRRLATSLPFFINRKDSAIENIPHTLFHTQIYTPIQSFSSHLYVNLLRSHLGSRVNQSVGRSPNQIAETRRHHNKCMERSQRRIMAVKAAVVTRDFYLKIIVKTLWNTFLLPFLQSNLHVMPQSKEDKSLLYPELMLIKKQFFFLQNISNIPSF